MSSKPENFESIKIPSSCILDESNDTFPNEKQCSKCGEDKCYTEFYKNISKRDGLESHCKECVNRKKARRYKDARRREKICTKFKAIVVGTLLQSTIDGFAPLFAESMNEWVGNDGLS